MTILNIISVAFGLIATFCAGWFAGERYGEYRFSIRSWERHQNLRWAKIGAGGGFVFILIIFLIFLTYTWRATSCT